MFCIVETIEDGVKKCTAVPKCWVANKKFLLWPNTTKELKRRKDCIQPSPEWEKINCRILFDNIGMYRLLLIFVYLFSYLYILFICSYV